MEGAKCASRLMKEIKIPHRLLARTKRQERKERIALLRPYAMQAQPLCTLLHTCLVGSYRIRSRLCSRFPPAQLPHRPLVGWTRLPRGSFSESTRSAKTRETRETRKCLGPRPLRTAPHPTAGGRKELVQRMVRGNAWSWEPRLFAYVFFCAKQRGRRPLWMYTNFWERLKTIHATRTTVAVRGLLALCGLGR